MVEYVTESLRSKLVPSVSNLKSFSLNVYARSPLELTATALFVSFS